MGPEVQGPAGTGLAPTTDDTTTRNIGHFLGGLEYKGHAQVPDASGTPGPSSNTGNLAGLDQAIDTAQTPLFHTDRTVEKTPSGDQTRQLAPPAHTLPGGWQTRRHATCASGVPVPPPRVSHCGTMHGASDIRGYHGNRPRGPPVGHASSIPPEPARADHVDRGYGILEPAQCGQILRHPPNMGHIPHTVAVHSCAMVRAPSSNPPHARSAGHAPSNRIPQGNRKLAAPQAQPTPPIPPQAPQPAAQETQKRHVWSSDGGGASESH